MTTPSALDHVRPAAPPWHRARESRGLPRRGTLRAGAVAIATAATGLVSAPAAFAQIGGATAGETRPGERGRTGAGLSRARLGRLHDVLAGYVERGEVPGVVALVCRRGEVHVDALGTLAAGGAPMRRDTLFRLASLTKPVTAAAALLLVEEARLRLDDPVDPWLPELADRRVLRRVDGPLDDTVPAERPITLRDLLTFRLGLGLVPVFPSRYPIQRAMEAAGVAPGAHPPSMSPDEYLRRVGGLPLVHQPGAAWLYHTGSDLLGVLLARATGQPLGAFLGERLFAPLGMRDTGFWVPEAKLDRLATCYQTEPTTGGLAVLDAARGGRFAGPPLFESGGGGLVSTADDYLAFCRMLLHRGEHAGQRVLSRPAVELMTADHLTAAQKAASPFGPGFWDTRGWGFGLSVITRRDDLAGGPGRFGWDGAYGTSGYADPTEDLIGILLAQRLVEYPSGPRLGADFWTAAYQAIDD
jgi:CubicO group peptidase (beta-lactamase class C family)